MAGALSLPAAAQLLTPGQFKVGMEISYPPFESYDGDKVVGSDPEFSHLLAEQMQAKAVFIDTRFTGLILGLSAGKFDAVISGMYITPERQKQADAIPYARTGAAIMVTQDSPVKPQTEQDLCGLKVGLQQGTVWVGMLKTLSDTDCRPAGKAPIVVQEFPSAPEVSQALMSKNVQVQMEIAGAAHMFAQRTKGRIIVTSSTLIYPQTLGIYVKKGNDQLLSAIKQAMTTLRANGQYQALLEKYQLEPVPAE
ncbi:ABC transporter substrate-binding protein [Affinibrenneria salicis]|uniref:ABC transporter substrate-binding protein n=2 Tax=Affinibrenneria salicis TaxID=2590031 RepID=A0A5J5G173_9GAMM|nr:ABC transporter substrate-binding protein [Affinibrenneria salicis]